MTKARIRKTLYASALLLLPAVFLVCSADNPAAPILNPVIPPITTNLPSIDLRTTRFDLSANGTDSVVITAHARDSAGNPLPGAQILWNLIAEGFNGLAGRLSGSLSITDGAGNASTSYIAPRLDFVPVGAHVTVRATLSVPGNPEGSPRDSLTLILRPKGNPPATTDPNTGEILAPIVTSVTPIEIKVDANPPVTVIVQGMNFADDSEVLLVTSDDLVTIEPAFFSSQQIRFEPPAGLGADFATLFVTGPGDLLSTGVAVILVTGTEVFTPFIPPPVIANILPTQIVVETQAEMVIVGSGINVQNCPCPAGVVCPQAELGNITFINEFGLFKMCPSEASSDRLSFLSPIYSTVQSGTVDVFVLNDDGNASEPVQVQVLPEVTNAPVITGLSPNTGPTTGETRVLITGSNFAPDHKVIIAGPNVFSPPDDFCNDNGNGIIGDGGDRPVCANNQCELSARRNRCLINGTEQDPFEFGGSGQISVIMPAVGQNAAGPVDVVIETLTGLPSNIATYLYTAPADLRPPEIDFIDPEGYRFDGCCQAGWGLLVRGRGFRRCSSLILTNFGQVRELLPTPIISDCGLKRASTSTQSPRERLLELLPPDGMTINCSRRPDLIPFRQLDTNLFQHDRICEGATSETYAPFVGRIIGEPPNDVANGGAYQWTNESVMRLFYGPDHQLLCESNDAIGVYVSNDPGRGLAGDLISNPAELSFANSQECGTETPTPTPTPLPDPSITTISPDRSDCRTNGTFVVDGTGFFAGSTITVDFEFGNTVTATRINDTTITGPIPAAPSSCTYTCPPAVSCPPVAEECQVTLFLDVDGRTATCPGCFTYLEPTSCTASAECCPGQICSSGRCQ